MEEIKRDNRLRIVTPYKIKSCPLWDRSVSFINYRPKHWKIANRFPKEAVRIIDDLILLIIFFVVRKKYDVLITYRDRASNIFSMIQGLFGKKIHHIMLNCLWTIPKTRMFKILRQKNLEISLLGVDKFAVSATHETEGYYKIFNLPKDKFTYIPYYFTPAASRPKVTEGNYIFSGGHPSYRDYDTLLKAVEGLDIQCKIATQLPEHFSRMKIPSNVYISYMPEKEYFRCMAECKMVIVPLRKDHFRSTGQRTYLNAMLMGKPIIVCDDKGAYDYIDNGNDGIIIPPCNAEALKKTIKRVLNSDGEIEIMTERAKEKAIKFTIENTMGQILALAEKVANKKL